jgi:hypothetical protein
MHRERQRRCGSSGQNAKEEKEKETNMRKLILAPLFAAAVALGAPGVAMAATQNGLVNVNVENIAAAVPISVAVPIGVAANVCDVSVLSLQDQTGDMTCTATNNSTALSRAIALAVTEPSGGGGGGGNTRQSGLVNVNLESIALAVPVSVAVPVGVAANVCGVSVLSLHDQTGDMACTATNTSTALTEAIARAIAGG